MKVLAAALGLWAFCAGMSPALAKPAANGPEARAFLGGRTGKMIYIKTFDHKLYFVDFDDSVLVERKVSDDQYVLNPKISPDGSRVVYESYGVIYIRELVENSKQRWAVMTAPFVSGKFYEPHWWIHPATKAEYILYSTGEVAENEWPPKAGSTFLQRIVQNKPDSAPTTLLPFTMGGGRSADGKWGATANHSTGMFKLYPEKISDAFFSSKNWLDLGAYLSCNPSISPSKDTSRMSRMLHLTSGYGTLGGKAYDNHRAVIMRSWNDADLDQPLWFMGPLGDRVDNDGSGNLFWHYNEWSNDENYFVVNGSTIIENWDTADVYIVKINFQGNSKLLRVLQGGGLNVVPDLWIKDGVLPARIRLETDQLNFISLREDTANPPAQNLAVSNAGDGTLPALKVGPLPKWLAVGIEKNGTNAPVLVHRVFRDSVAVGEYRATVGVTFGNGVDSASYQVDFKFLDPVLTSLQPRPEVAVLLPGDTLRLSAIGLDQTGEVLARQPTVLWSAPAGISGLGAEGLFSADTSAPGWRAAPYGFLATGTGGAVKCTAEVRVARHWLRADLGWDRETPKLPPERWDNAPSFRVTDATRIFGGLSPDDTLDWADAADPAPDSVYRTSERISGFRFAGLPKGRYRLRGHLATPGLADTSQAKGISLKLEGKTAFEGVFPRLASPKKWRAMTFTAEATVSDTDGLSGEFSGLSEANWHVAGLEAFDIGLPPVTVTSPNGGETHHAGDTLRIRWGTDGGITSVGIQVSLDSGKKWIPITRTASVEEGEPAWGDYPWVIPDSLDGLAMASTQAMISVYDYFGTDRDRSDAVFTLSPLLAGLNPEDKPGSGLAASRFQAFWHPALGLQLRGLKAGTVDLALLDSKGRWQAAQRHIPVSLQGEARWSAQAPRGLYRLMIRQGPQMRAMPLVVY